MIIFINELFLVAHKPNDINFHSEGEAGFIAMLSKNLNTPLFPVHRLDKMTSGLLLIARSSEIAALFGEMFEKRQVEKYYLALSLRKPKKKQGWIKGDMEKSRRGSYKLLTTHNNPAITQFISASVGPHQRLYLIKPHTGKTHQIRVALKSIGSAIAGDQRYAHKDEAVKEDRGYLHAYGLRFVLLGKSYSFVEAPISGKRFLESLTQEQILHWKEPWSFFK